MSNIRVKDLAKELEVGNKEILQILRELGIQAKSQMGALTEEEASQVRLKARSMGGQTQVIDTEVQPGVIVRRRKPARDRQAPASEPAPRDEEHPEPVSEAPEAPVAAHTPPDITAEAAVETPTAEIVEPPKKRPGRQAPVETRARIISQPEPEAPESETAPPVQAEMETAAVVEAVEEAEAVSELTPEAPETETASEQAPGKIETAPADAETPPRPPRPPRRRKPEATRKKDGRAGSRP